MKAVLVGNMLRVALIFMICLPSSVFAEGRQSVELRDFAIAGDAVKTRLLFNLDADIQPKITLLRAPHRLVIDLPSARFHFDPASLKARGLVTDIRYGAISDAMSRIVVSAKGPFRLADFDMIAKADKGGHRLVFDLEAASDQAFEDALAEQSTTTNATSEVAGEQGARRYRIVIDPGHGGFDGGAEGLSGTAEKTVTLAFAKELRDQIAKSGDLDVSLTREDDTFLRLDERVRIARQRGADLFISIHADTIRLKGIRGATVYTVSDRASDAESAAVADRENLSDQLSGIEIKDQNHEVADILVDLIRRETHAFSMGFARTLVAELGNTVTMINNPHRFAGFRVLRAPDVPSVLIELGYLSNEADEKQLLSADWRSKAAKGIVSAIRQFADTRIGGR